MHEIEPIWTGPDNLIIRDPDIPANALLATTRQTYAPNIANIEILPDIEQEENGEEPPAPDKP